MTTKARCKFKCISAEPLNTTGTVVMQTDYDKTGVPEDESFNIYTPWGEMKFSINNPALAGFFQPGKSYYIDISPVE